MTAAWSDPPRRDKEDGSERRVGVELELQGIDPEPLADLVADVLGGAVEPVSPAEYTVVVPDHGDYRVEVDFALLKDMAKRHGRLPGDDVSLEALLVDALGAASKLLVPCEIVAPPLPMSRLAGAMDPLVEAIRKAGGKGTRRSVLFAFGVHLNVEPPDLSAQTVTRYLKAFVCLFDWLVWKGEVDLSRRVTPHIDRFPGDYETLVAAVDYSPDWPELIADYLAANATRNRALDMLPMFAHVDEAAIDAEIDDDLVKARPAFHYRLANSCVDEPDWGIAGPWNRWVCVERLANDKDRLRRFCDGFQEDRARLLTDLDNAWRKTVDEWLDES